MNRVIVVRLAALILPLSLAACALDPAPQPGDETSEQQQGEQLYRGRGGSTARSGSTGTADKSEATGSSKLDTLKPESAGASHILKHGGDESEPEPSPWDPDHPKPKPDPDKD